MIPSFFIRRIVSACVVLVFVASGASAVEPLRLKAGQMYLIFDPRLQGVEDAAELVVHQFQRYAGNPIVRPSLSSGKSAVSYAGHVLREDDTQLFKMWYYAGKADSVLTGYATSKDGIHWDKPSLGLYEVNGSSDNNICYKGLLSLAVYRNPRPGGDDDRYVAFGLQHDRSPDGFDDENSVYRFISPDGIRWTRSPRTPCIPGNARRSPTYPGDPGRALVEGVIDDVSYTFWLPQLDRFLCFHKIMVPNPRKYSTTKGVGNCRQFARFESADGIRWDSDNPTWAFYVDEKDEAWEPYVQFYGMGLHPVGDFYLATTMLWHSGKEDHIEVGLACSTDTITWHRPFRGQYVLPRGAEGEWDWGQVRQAGNIIEKDGMWWLYYTGMPFTHDDPLRKEHYYAAMGLARMPAGRIVSARCWKGKGRYTVGPVLLTGRTLKLNARVYKEMDVELLDESGQPLAGFTANLKMIDDSGIPVQWAQGDLSGVRDKPVRIRFNMQDAEVFALTCE